MSDGSLESGEFPVFIEEYGIIARDDGGIVGEPLAVAVAEDPGGSSIVGDVSLGNHREWN